MPNQPNQPASDAVPLPRAEEPTQRYSAFTTVEKWCIVAMVSYAAWFSTLSSFIYYPAIPAISKALGVSVDKINLTITTYMAIASIAPALVGDAADILGRRPVYMLTLSGYFAANFAIALTRSYEALLGLRVLQALCISGTFSIAYGVVTDLASPARGGHSLLLSLLPIMKPSITIAPSIGPILGGTLTYAAGWPWIFWFLCLASGSCLVIMSILLPETSRHVVGDGSIPPPSYLRLPLPTILRHWKETETDSNLTARPLRVPNPFKSIVILCHKDNAVVIFACGLLYVVYTCINASLATLLVDIYHLNQWEAGLIYLPFGLGGVASAFISGKILDRAWQDTRQKLGITTDSLVGDDLDTFPVEKARLCVIWIPMFVTVCSVIAFGWTLHSHLHIAIPLALQFVAGLCMQLDFSIYNTLLVDKNHRAPSAAQASSNIVRCTLAAFTVSFLQQLIVNVGIGWTFTFMGILCLLAMALFAIDYQRGGSWRESRLPRIEI